MFDAGGKWDWSTENKIPEAVQQRPESPEREPQQEHSDNSSSSSSNSSPVNSPSPNKTHSLREIYESCSFALLACDPSCYEHAAENIKYGRKQ